MISGNSHVPTLFFFGVCLPRGPQLLHHGQPIQAYPKLIQYGEDGGMCLLCRRLIMLYAFACLCIDVQSSGALNSTLVNIVVSRSSAVKISGHDFRT